MDVETVLLDAGGVLLDLDYPYLARLVRARGHEADPAELCRLESLARREMHRHVHGGGRVSEAWRDYFHVILSHAGVAAEEREPIIDSLWEAHQRFGLWTIAIDGAPATVAELKRRGYRLGVVSNAEGRVERDLDAAGYRGFFETVVDSHVVGFEKPQPEIFRVAMERMGVGPERAVFLGDVPAVDVAGARAAGLRPLLLDRHDLYPDADVPRLRAIADLPAWLEAQKSTA